MKELSLNILDITENSVKAGATLTEIKVNEDNDSLVITISDNGCGMPPDVVEPIRFTPQEPLARWGWVSRFSSLRRSKRGGRLR